MTYELNYAIHPGVSVSAAITHLGMTQKGLAERTQLSEKTISQIINGDASITAETAAKFENVLGGTAYFWMSLESQYRTSVLRVSQTEKAKQEVELASYFPYNELVKRKCVDSTKNTVERVFNLWRFFGVDSLSTIPSIEVAAYRRGYIEINDSKRGALAAWLRCGENAFIKEISPKLREYDATKLKSTLPIIRKMTQMVDANFFINIQNILADTGVGLVAVQYFEGTKASGATRWIGGNPLIQLSTFGKNADKVWFTLFHEIGHILLNGKKEQFISFTETSKDPDEIKADEFAADLLIPANIYANFLKSLTTITEEVIRSFAKKQEIDPGIVVGRLKNDKVLAYSAYSRVHTKLQMKSD